MYCNVCCWCLLSILMNFHFRCEQRKSLTKLTSDLGRTYLRLFLTKFQRNISWRAGIIFGSTESQRIFIGLSQFGKRSLTVHSSHACTVLTVWTVDLSRFPLMDILLLL